MIFFLVFTLFGLLQAMLLSPYSRMNALSTRQTARTRCVGPRCYAVPPGMKYEWAMESNKKFSFLKNEMPPPTVIPKWHSHDLCLVPKIFVMGACTVVQVVTFVPFYCYHMGRGNPILQFFSLIFYTAYSINKELAVPEKKIEHFGNYTFYVCPPGNDYESLESLEQICYAKVSPYQRSYNQEDRIAHTAVGAKDIDESVHDPKDFLEMISAKFQKFVLVPYDLDNEEILPTSPVFKIKKHGKEIVFCKE